MGGHVAEPLFTSKPISTATETGNMIRAQTPPWRRLRGVTEQGHPTASTQAPP